MATLAHTVWHGWPASHLDGQFARIGSPEIRANRIDLRECQQVREKQGGGWENSGEGKEYHKALPKNGFGPPHL